MLNKIKKITNWRGYNDFIAVFISIC